MATLNQGTTCPLSTPLSPADIASRRADTQSELDVYNQLGAIDPSHLWAAFEFAEPILVDADTGALFTDLRVLLAEDPTLSSSWNSAAALLVDEVKNATAWERIAWNGGWGWRGTGPLAGNDSSLTMVFSQDATRTIGVPPHCSDGRDAYPFVEGMLPLFPYLHPPPSPPPRALVATTSLLTYASFC